MTKSLTFYALVEPGVRIPIGKLDRLPDDWIQLKTHLAEAMKRLYIERRQTRAVVSLERHMGGKSTTMFAPGTYIERKVRYARQPEAVLEVEFNPTTDRVEKVYEANFGYSLRNVATDYWDIERNIRWRSPPIIPKDHKSYLEDPSQILREPSSTRYADYSRTPKDLYGYGGGGEEHPHRTRYARSAEPEYGKRFRPYKERA